MRSNPDNLTVVKDQSRKDILFALARPADRQSWLVASSDAKIHELDPLSDDFQPREFGQQHLGYVTGMALTAENQLVSGAYDGKLVWWDIDSGKAIRSIQRAHGKWIRDVTASPDGATLVTVADDMIARTWDAVTGEFDP